MKTRLDQERPTRKGKREGSPNVLIKSVDLAKLPRDCQARFSEPLNVLMLRVDSLKLWITRIRLRVEAIENVLKENGGGTVLSIIVRLTTLTNICENLICVLLYNWKWFRTIYLPVFSRRIVKYDIIVLTRLPTHKTKTLYITTQPICIRMQIWQSYKLRVTCSSKPLVVWCLLYWSSFWQVALMQTFYISLHTTLF